MLAIGNKTMMAFGLVSLLLFTTGCKEDPCVKKVEESISLQPVKGSNQLLMPVDKLDFLADPSIVWDDIDLELTLSGKHSGKENIWLAFNGIKFNRKDGRRSLESMNYTAKKNSVGVFKLHKMYLNGAEPFHQFLARIKKNKGILQVHVYGKNVEIVAAKITFKGNSRKNCGGSATPTPTPTATPVPVAPETTIDAVEPAKATTASTSIAISFSSDTEGNTFWCSLDGSTAEKCTSPQSYSNLASGNHSFSVYAQNPQGIVDSSPATYSWKIDTSAPSATITNSGSLPTLTNSAAVSFEFTSSKPNSTFKCSLDGATATTCTSPASYSALAEGVHVFTVNATDSLGNVSKVPASFRWTVDTTVPVATFIDIVPAESVSNNTSKAFTFTADESADFECSLDNGAFSVCNSPLQVTNLADGNHWFEVRATDSAGNAGLSVSYSWSIDTVAPVVKLGLVNPVETLNNAKSVFVEFGVNESATVYCSFDGAQAQACSSPYTVKDLSEGDHSLVVTAVDAAGNASQPVTLNWTMDFSAPVISFGDIQPSAASRLNETAVQIPVNAPQGTSLYASINGGAASPIQSAVSLSGLTEGSYVVSVYGVDAAGNASEPLVHEFAVDLTAPSVSLMASVLANPTNLDLNSFEISASEASTFECALDNAGFEACVSPKDVSGLAEGTHLFQVRARDLAGNLSPVAQYTWLVDTKPPVTSLTALVDADSASFNLSANEPGASFVCSLDGVPVTPCSTSVYYTGLSLGSHSFLAKAVDTAGNVDPVGASYQFTVIKPIKTIITSATPGESPTNKVSIIFEFVADQANATFKCSLDNSPLVACSSPMTYSGLGDGTHKFVVKAVDAFGNIDTTGASYSWSVDSAGPEVSNLVLSVTTNSITVSWTTSEPATRQVFFGVGSALNQATAESSELSTTHSVKLTGLSANTTYSVQVKGRDSVGNVYQSAVRTAKTSR